MRRFRISGFLYLYNVDSKQAIGVFDSGVGGLTVVKALQKVLPTESIVYFGDTAHLPYGDKSSEAIIQYSMGITDFLKEKHHVKAILVACNSASAVAFGALGEAFHGIPLFNVIDPVVSNIARIEDFKKVGIIGTRTTIQSETYTNGLKALNPNLNVNALATPLLVPIIEEGLAHSPISRKTIKHYLSQEGLSDIEALILGCTHYPHIQNEIEAISKKRFKVIDSPKIVAETVKYALAKDGLLNTRDNKGVYRFYVSDYTEVFESMARLMFDRSLTLTENNIWK